MFAHHGKVERLSAAHAPDARGARERLREARGNFRVNLRDGNDGECLRLKRIARKHRERLAVLHVAGRAPAAQRIVVHRWHVVVHEAVAVDHFKRKRRTIEHGFIRAGDFARRVAEKRPDALSASEDGIAHGADEALRTCAGTRHHRFRRPFEMSCALVRPGLKAGRPFRFRLIRHVSSPFTRGLSGQKGESPSAAPGFSARMRSIASLARASSERQRRRSFAPLS